MSLIAFTRLPGGLAGSDNSASSSVRRSVAVFSVLARVLLGHAKPETTTDPSPATGPVGVGLMSWCGGEAERLVQREWQPGTPEDKQRARAALAGALDGWLVAGDALLTPEGGWPLGPPASSSDTWPAVLYQIAYASDGVARYSETVRRRGRREGLEPYARHAQIEIDRLAALIISELGESHIAREPIVDEADTFVDEVDDEHNGMLHTADAIGSLLQARLVCAEDQLDLPASELATAAVRILAPLLAQRVCVLV